MLPDAGRGCGRRQHLLIAVSVLGNGEDERRSVVLGDEVKVVGAGRGVDGKLGVDADVEDPLPALRCGDVDPGRDGDVRDVRKGGRRHGQVALAGLGKSQRLAHLARWERIGGGLSEERSVVLVGRGISRSLSRGFIEFPVANETVGEGFGRGRAEGGVGAFFG